MKRYNIKFKYADSMSKWEWRNQECTLYASCVAEARMKCMDFYGLGKDCDYEILDVKEVD